MDKLAEEILSDYDFNDAILAYEADKERMYEAMKNCRHHEPKVPYAKLIDNVKRNFETVFRDMANTNPRYLQYH